MLGHTWSAIPDVNVQICPPEKRFDVGRFRCLDCPRVIPNQVPLARINTLTKKRIQKFSPGLPQNETCGCWRAQENQTINVALNSSSWVVSGLLFNASRGRWLRQFNIQASGDNTTFVDWGTYTATNFTDASIALFSFPIRAQFFNINVLRYANHYVNESGFPISVQALVSHEQPFSCGCPLLSNGE